MKNSPKSNLPNDILVVVGCCCWFTMGLFSDSIVVALAISVTIKRDRILQIMQVACP